jgi:hypothetical protein
MLFHACILLGLREILERHMEDDQDIPHLPQQLHLRTNSSTCYKLVMLQGLREILERCMEDDQDMYRMCFWRHIWA